MKIKFLPSTILVVGLLLSGCTEISALFNAGTTTANAPASVTTLVEAEQSAILVTKAVDVYVNTGSPNRATLLKLQQLSNTVHAALVSLEQANAENKPLVFASFNAAVAAFNAYKGN